MIIIGILPDNLSCFIVKQRVRSYNEKQNIKDLNVIEYVDVSPE